MQNGGGKVLGGEFGVEFAFAVADRKCRWAIASRPVVTLSSSPAPPILNVEKVFRVEFKNPVLAEQRDGFEAVFVDFVQRDERLLCCFEVHRQHARHWVLCS